jgi:hypothetical protein
VASVETILQKFQIDSQKLLLDTKSKQLQAQAKLKESLLGLAQKGADTQQKLQQAQADAEAEGGGGLPSAVDVPPPAPTRALNGVPTSIDPTAIAEAIATNGPGGIQQAVQTGGDVSIPGLDQIPSHLTSTQQSRGVQFFQDKFGILPVQTSESRVSTRPNALTPRDVLQLQLAQQADREARANRRAQLTLEVAKTFGGDVSHLGGVAEAMERGDTATIDRLLGGRKTLSEKEAESLASLRAQQAELVRAQIGQVRVETDVARQQLLQTASSMPLTVMGGFRSPLAAQQAFEKQNPNVLEDNWRAMFKDGDFKGTEASLTALQGEFIDRGQFRPVYTSRIRDDRAPSYPVTPIVDAMTLLAAGPTIRKAQGVEEKQLLETLKEAGIRVGEGGHYFHSDKINNQIVNVLEQAADTQLEFARKTGLLPKAPTEPLTPTPTIATRSPEFEHSSQLGAKLRSRMEKALEPSEEVQRERERIRKERQANVDQIAGFLQGLIQGE